MTFSQRLKDFRAKLLLMLAVIGPGIITANVDNDAGGISTYSVAGAHYGYNLLWMMPLVLLALIIVQEMSARLGVMTGKGLGDLIRENMGVRLTTGVLSLLVFVNLANTVSEFAGIAASLEIFGISKRTVSGLKLLKTPQLLSVRWRVNTPRFYLPSVCSMPLCSQPPFYPCPLPTRFARRLAGNLV